MLISAGLACAGAFSLLLGIHPFSTYPLSLALLARVRPKPIAAAAPAGSVAMCVCAYNEEAVIGQRIDNMLSLRAAWPDLDLLVYVDAASDRTAEIVCSYGNQIRYVISQERQGKTVGMNQLVSMTDADLLVFSDANVRFAVDALSHLLAPFADGSVGCVGGHLVYTTPGEKSVTAETGSLYWKLEERIKELESHTGSMMGADGSIFAIRKRLHTPPPADLIDDMFVSLSILCGGYRIVRAGKARAFEEIVSRPGEEFRRKVRIACQAFNVHRALRHRLHAMPMLDRYKYVSHKLVRWFTIYLLGFAVSCWFFAIVAAQMPVTAIVFAVCVAAGVVLAFLLPRKPATWLADILSAFAATGLGVWRSLAGDRFQTWTPPSSARGAGDSRVRGSSGAAAMVVQAGKTRSSSAARSSVNDEAA